MPSGYRSVAWGFDNGPSGHVISNFHTSGSSNLTDQAAGGSMKHRALKLFAMLLLSAILAAAQDLASFEKRVTVKKLGNGLTAVICERPEAPVFSFFTHVDAGSAQDPTAKTGLAHMFEHMAFKGTETIGTKDYAA